MKRSLWKIVGAAIFALAGLGSVNLGIWVADRDPPIIYEEAKALSPTVEQGGTIEIEFSVFRSRIDCRVGLSGSTRNEGASS